MQAQQLATQTSVQAALTVSPMVWLSGRGRLIAYRVSYALFVKTRLGRAGELLFGRGRITGFFCVRFALFHKAGHGGAGQFFVGGIALARGVGAGRYEAQQSNQCNAFHNPSNHCFGNRPALPIKHAALNTQRYTERSFPATWIYSRVATRIFGFQKKAYDTFTRASAGVSGDHRQ